ncbi:hypothetical protein Cgig2_025737 [Carnegiea gigantea]|uniref:Ycf2 N-terminal domain-containing protein n=1 Tax=Carnegiea gigantea TaxID=171969 RepID=A0A9Q1JNY1_9CARY|nr:hypothetical protein Cgig2_025737 [Carnegiea gigantea]
MYRTFQEDILDKWNRFQTYMPLFLTSTGYKYRHLILKDTFSDLFPMLSSRLSILHKSWLILKTKWCLGQWNLKISEISSKWLHNLLLAAEMIHRNNESPWTSPNVWEFFYSILFLLLVAGYLVRTHLIFVLRASSELQTEFEKKKYWNINLIDLISIIPNPINRITFSRNTRHLSHKSKEIHSFIRSRGYANKMLKADWSDDKIESWVGSTHAFSFPISWKTLFAPLRPIPLVRSFSDRFYRNWTLVKYLATNSYVPFITVFLNKFLDNKPSGFLIDDSDDIDAFDDIDRDLDTELELLTMMNALTMDMDMMPEIDPFSITLQFELAKAMSPCIIWIPNINDLDVNESNYLSLGLLVNYLSRDCERWSKRNIEVIASTHIPL